MDLPAIARAFAEDGAAVCRGLVPAEACEAVRAAFLEECKPFTGPLPRQAGGAVPHALDAQGRVTNHVAYLHASGLPRLAVAPVDVMRASEVVPMAAEILGERPALLQSTYTEVGLGARPHRDHHPLAPGRLIGVWIALEDIRPGSGRFCVWPHSWRLPDEGVLGRLRERYEARYVRFQPEPDEPGLYEALDEMLREGGLQALVPELGVGDAVWWDSRTLHGSEAPVHGGPSRHALILHFVPLSDVQGADVV